MEGLYVVTGLSLFVSFLVNKEKTFQGLKRGWMKFYKTLPSYLMLLILISIVLLLSEDFIIEYLGQDNIYLGLLFSLGIGSVTMMPGFIAYPLSRILLQRGVPYMVIAGFVTSLMLVGVVTYPLEKSYMGRKATILRNIMSFIVAGLIALVIGIAYGEIF
jgi:Predicted permeases